MRKYDLEDKAVLLICCTAISLMRPLAVWHVVPVLAAVIATGLVTFLEDIRYKFVMIVLFTVASLIYPPIYAFIPLMLYSSYDKEHLIQSGIFLIPIAAAFDAAQPIWLATVALSAVALILKNRTSIHEKLRVHYLSLLDTTREMAREIKEQNRILTESQDDKIRLATLNERNRISREIHDHVGHRLSSAFLQIGAILEHDPKDERLSELKDTLSLAMDSIRKSVHDIYDSSIDLVSQIESLAAKLTCCRVELNINVPTDPDAKVKYALISAVKETFSNIARHSDADLVRLNLIEHPAFYQMTVSDNGSTIAADLEKGMGLKSIASRVEALNGYFLIRTNNGFEIFLTIPKEAQ